MESTFYLMNPWWEGKPFETGITREKYFTIIKQQLKTKQIVFLTGLRRVGKTTLLKQVIKELLKSVEANKILYLTLDFITFEKRSIHQLVDEFRLQHNHTKETELYLFLDEVAAIHAFEQELKNLYDLENVKIFASSSSTSVMESKNSYLVGRSRFIEVLPLDFEEFLLFKKISFKKSDAILLQNAFEEYLNTGGMPEYVLHQDINVLKDTVQQIIYKDIISFYDVKDKESVEKLFLLLCERIGKRITYSKLARVLGITVDSVRRYVHYFENTFLFYIIEKHARSMNERMIAPKKVYTADIGIRNAYVGFKDKGALMENVVFMKIKDKKVSYFFENEHEIDFIVGDNIAIEVKYKQEIEEKDLHFFNHAPFKKKIVIQSYKDLKQLDKL